MQMPPHQSVPVGGTPLVRPIFGTCASPNKSNRLGVPSTNTKHTVEETRRQLRNMLEGKKIIMEFKAWMTAFIPTYNSKHRSRANTFRKVPDFGKETEMYTWHVNALNKARLGEQWVFVGNPNKSDPNATTKEVVDCGMYPAAFAPVFEKMKPVRVIKNAPGVRGTDEEASDGGDKNTTTANSSERDQLFQNRRLNWSRIDLPIECKVHHTDADPFDDNKADGEPTAIKRQAALGQILSYAEQILMHQHRQFFFMVILLGHYARIVRFDHSGLFATKKFNYKMHGELLTAFFKCYTQLSDADRGYDTTARRLEPGSELHNKMRELSEKAAEVDSSDHVQELFRQSLDDRYPWWELNVHVVKTPSGEPGSLSPPQANGDNVDSSGCSIEVRRFVVGKPHFHAPGVVGRATRGYVAVGVDDAGELIDFKRRRLYDRTGKLVCVSWAEALKDKEKTKRAVSSCFVYLKDAWRVDHDGIEQEGSVLELLNASSVPSVPRLVCHGDIRGQVTIGQEIWQQQNTTEDLSKCSLKRHQHYRLVVEQVGKPLDQFQSGFQLVFALCCALRAHMQAYKKLGIIHRDISSGNILLYKNEKGAWEGLLNDWELSKKQVDGEAEARQPDRTGTWQFMSAHALNDPSRDIVVADEIESILHVLIYYAVRFLPHNLQPEKVPHFLVDYFDGFVEYSGEGYGCGTAKYSAMENGRIKLSTYNLKGSTLEFYRTQIDTKNPELVRSKHPINNIIDAVLSWLRSYYALDEANKACVEVTLGVGVDKSDFLSVFDSEDENKLPEDSLTNVELEGEPTTSGGNVPPPADLALAEKLDNHDAVYSLFMTALRHAHWPPDDKGEDMKPQEGAAARRRQKVPTGTDALTQTNSRKRTRVDEVAGSTSKRLRSGN